MTEEATGRIVMMPSCFPHPHPPPHHHELRGWDTRISFRLHCVFHPTILSLFFQRTSF